MLPNDPVLLVGYLNLKLRDEFSSLEDLCDTLDIDQEFIIKKLREAGYEYREDSNQFR